MPHARRVRRNGRSVLGEGRGRSRSHATRGEHGAHQTANQWARGPALGAHGLRAHTARVWACVGGARRAMLARMERQTANRLCVGCGAPTLRRANAIRCAVCARAARLARKAARNREARAAEIAARRPRQCSACGRAIVGRRTNARRCIECVKPSRRKALETHQCVDCGIDLRTRRSDARRCRPCARKRAAERERVRRAQRKA